MSETRNVPISITRPPTRRQLDVLRAMERFRIEHGYLISRQELAAAIGISSRSSDAIDCHLDGLEKRGMVVRGQPGKARSTVLTARGRAAISGFPEANYPASDYRRAPTGKLDPGWRCMGCGAHSFNPAGCFVCTHLPELSRIPPEASA